MTMKHDNGSSDLDTRHPSIFDDSDPCYHADPLTGQTPAKARKIEAAMASTSASTPSKLARVALVRKLVPAHSR